jgi:hypothetical protein
MAIGSQDSTPLPTLVGVALPAEAATALAEGARALGLRWVLGTSAADVGDAGPIVVFCGDALQRVPIAKEAPPFVGIFVGRAADGIATFVRGGGAAALRWPWDTAQTPALLAQILGLPPEALPADLQPRRRA